MKELLEIVRKTILWTAANFFIFNVLFPLLFLMWDEAETIPVDEQEN